MNTEARNQARQYILDRIDCTGYNTGKELETPKEKLQFLHDTFKSEYGYMIERVGEYKAFTEWLQGLPSAINIDFYNYTIVEFAKSWGSIPQDASEKEEDKIINNWFNYITNQVFQLNRKYGVK